MNDDRDQIVEAWKVIAGFWESDAMFWQALAKYYRARCQEDEPCLN